MDVENRVERIFMEGQWLIGVDDFEFDPISLIKAGQVLSGVRNSCLIGINAVTRQLWAIGQIPCGSA